MIQLQVNINDSGEVQVIGPLHEKEWCLRALRLALKALTNYRDPILPVLKDDTQIADSFFDSKLRVVSDSDGKEE